MPLPQSSPRIPTAIGQTYFELVDDDGTVPSRQIRARATVLDQDEKTMPRESWSGDLVPHMTQAEITWLNAFLDKYRAMAIADILPTS